MTLRKSTLIIPVENQLRELDAKLLLSCVAAERGFPVVLGSRAFIHFAVASLPRGVYLAKSMRALSNRMFDIIRKVGHEIVAWDEEALVRAPDAQYWERRLSAGTVQKVSAIIAWGPDDARVFREYPGYTGAPIYITGNPRVDMMRREVRSFYNEEVERIRERFGRFVLINTNFGWNNHFIPNFAQINNAGKPMGGFMTSLVAHRTAIFEHFQKMVPALSEALPGFTILVRPHPTESHVPWNEIAGGLGNVKVVHEGNVIPWLMACEALVHNSCTTAVEAFVLGTPAVAYQPVRMKTFDDELPNSLSHRAFSIEELGRTLGSILAGEQRIDDQPNRRQLIERHIAALEGPLAAERMVDVLEQSGYASRPPPRPSPSRYLEGWVHTKARNCVKAINMRRSKHRNSIEYHAHRFPDIAVEELREKVERLGKQLGRFEKVRVRQISQHIFGIDQ
jgi:surface carbohydrate biosynthesis protein